VVRDALNAKIALQFAVTKKNPEIRLYGPSSMQEFLGNCAVEITQVKSVGLKLEYGSVCKFLCLCLYVCVSRLPIDTLWSERPRRLRLR
jgi:hypothetical protein